MIYFVSISQLVEWLLLLLLAVFKLSVFSTDPKVLTGWILLAGMILTLSTTWMALVLTWKTRRHDQIVAIHTARLIHSNKALGRRQTQRKKSSKAGDGN